VDDVKELINIASMLQTSNLDSKQQSEQTNKLNYLLADIGNNANPNPNDANSNTNNNYASNGNQHSSQ
jgi:hypothetical protein